MKKPIVFLSHSTANKRELHTLKDLLDERSAGFINYFLSSDGKSIPLGVNWVVALNRALKDARLMFVFVSKEALKSDWLMFEAGHAYSQGVDVVPVCLPGIRIHQLPDPLKLLQAHTLHCARDVSALIRKCNDVFITRIPEKATPAEFSRIFGRLVNPEGTTNGHEWAKIVEEIEIEVDGPPGGAEIFYRSCRRRKFECYIDRRREPHVDVVSSGTTLNEASDWIEKKRLGDLVNDQHRYTLKISPKLFEIVAPVVDAWCKKMKFQSGLSVRAMFHYGVSIDSHVHHFTTKLYDSELKIVHDNFFQFRNVYFSLWDERNFSNHRHFRLKIDHCRKLTICEIPSIIRLLYQRDIFIFDREIAKKLKQRSNE